MDKDERKAYGRDLYELRNECALAETGLKIIGVSGVEIAGIRLAVCHTSDTSLEGVKRDRLEMYHKALVDRKHREEATGKLTAKP